MVALSELNKVGELSLPSGVTLTLLLRKDKKPQVPDKDTVLEGEDLALVVTSPENENDLRIALTQRAAPDEGEG